MVDRNDKFVKFGHLFLCIVLVVQLTGCGTLMYPERRGQKAGRIDTSVALLDGLGLLLFLIPGVIAFAVDFSNGTIYLPGTSAGVSDLKNIKQVKFDLEDRSLAGIEKIVKAQAGYESAGYQPGMKIVRVKSTADMAACFAQTLLKTGNDRLALIR